MRGVFCLLLIATTVPVAAEVRVRIDADGTRHMYNVGGSAARKTGARPLPAGEPTFDSLVRRYSRLRSLDVELVRAVVSVESAYDPTAVSSKGAMGLMQLMPATAAELAVGDPFDPEENLRGGTEYLRRLLDSFDGNLELALAAYNAGPDAVRRFSGVPPFPETIGFVEKVVRLYRRNPGYRLATAGGLGRGRRTYLSRGRDGLLVLSTTPPTR